MRNGPSSQGSSRKARNGGRSLTMTCVASSMDASICSVVALPGRAGAWLCNKMPPNLYEGQKSGQSQRVDYAGETSRTNTLPSQVVPYNVKVVQNFQEKLRAKYMAELPEICQFSAYIVFNLPA